MLARSRAGEKERDNRREESRVRKEEGLRKQHPRRSLEGAGGREGGKQTGTSTRSLFTFSFPMG